MKKLLITICVIAASVVTMLGFAAPAPADHINEPTHPIESFDLVVEDYANNIPVDCSGGVAPARKLRIQPIAESPEAFALSDPSEHFSTGWQIDRQVTNYKGQVSWVMEERTVWAHSNIPPHSGSPKFNVAYATIEPGQPNGGSSTVLSPGTYRLVAQLLADASGNHFVQVCNFTVI
jgi:hypothetical protein